MFLRCDSCTSGTVFSRNINKYDENFAENYVTIELSEGPNIVSTFKLKSPGDQTSKFVTISNGINLSEWVHLTVSWQYDNENTSIAYYVNDALTTSQTENAHFLEDSADYSSYWGVQENSTTE